MKVRLSGAILTVLTVGLIILTGVVLFPKNAAADHPGHDAINRFAPADPIEFGLPASAVEDVSQRSLASKSFVISPGVITAVFGAPMHNEIAPGIWADIDKEFRQDGPNFIATRIGATVRVNNVGVVVSDTATGQGIRWRTPGMPSVQGNRAVFADQGLVWQYTTALYGVKMDAIIPSPLGSKTYEFPYTRLGGLPALLIDVDGNAVSGNLMVNRPVIIGANGLTYLAGPWELTGNSSIRFTWDDSVLPVEAFPYVLDPTTTFNTAATADDGYARREESTVYPPDTATSVVTTSNILTRKIDEQDADPFHLSVGLWEWDTSSLPDSAVISAATFRTNISAVSGDDDSRNITLEWYVHGGIGTEDYTSTVGTDANAGVDITSLSVGSDNDFDLLNPASNISVTGDSGIRSHISGGEPAGNNTVHHRDYTESTSQAARLLVTFTATTAALTGTIGDGATEQEVRDGGGTIIVTLTDDTWVSAGATFDAQRQAIIDGLDAAESEVNGWNAQVRDQMGVTSVIRTSSTIATVTVSAAAVSSYQIDANEVITMTVPNAALVTASGDITATPTVAITAAAESAVVAGTLGGSGGTPGEIVAGGETILITLTNTAWVESGTIFDAIRQNILDGLVSDESDANGWDTLAFGVGDVVRTSGSLVTITLSAESGYAIPSAETITTTVPASAVGGGALGATPTFTITPAFQTSGIRVSTAIDLSSVTDLAYCAIGWESTRPANTTVTIETSVDGGANYSSASNGSCPTGLIIGESLATISDFRIRVTLATTDTSTTPLITALALLVEDSSGQDLYYQLNTTPSATLTDRSSNTNTGTMSFPIAPSGITITADPLESTEPPLTTQQALPRQEVTSAVSGSATSGNIFGEELGFDTLGLQGIVEAISGAGDGLPVRFVWYIFLGVFVIGVGMLMLHLTGDLLISAAAMAGMMGLLISIGDGLLEGWILWVFLPLAGSFLMFRKGFII